MNNNPLRIIAMCEVVMTNGSRSQTSVGIDMNYDATAVEIHDYIVNEMYDQLNERNERIESVVVVNVCNLGQVPMPEPVNTFSRINGIGMLPGVRECRVCGDDHGSSGLPCPKMTPMS